MSIHCEGYGLPSDFQCTVPTKPEVLRSCRELAHSEGSTGAGKQAVLHDHVPLQPHPTGTTSTPRPRILVMVVPEGSAALPSWQITSVMLRASGKPRDVAQNPIRSRPDAGTHLNPLRLSVIDDSIMSQRVTEMLSEWIMVEKTVVQRSALILTDTGISNHLTLKLELDSCMPKPKRGLPSTICSCDLQHSKSRDSALHSRDLLKLPGPALRSKRAQACR